MPRNDSVAAVLLAIALSAIGGCLAQKKTTPFADDTAHYQRVATEIDYPNVSTPARVDLLDTPRPNSLSNQLPPRFRELTLNEAVQSALANAQVIRDLGGTLIRSPDTAQTVYGAAVTETDPRFGVDAALAAFDAQYSTTLFYEDNHRAFNNSFFGGGTRLLKQEALVYQSQIAKTIATGGKVAFRHNTDYDANNAPGNEFPSAWNTNFEAEVRQPLAQGSGVQYNRIAGPTGVPGIFNGVMLARLRTDVSLTEFEAATRTLLSDVENAYWDLYFAYRDLDAKVLARNTALETWRRVNSLNATGRVGGEAEKEAHAREQYFRFEEEVQNALAGIAVDGTRTNNGTSGGTFRGQGGLQTTERRLRLLIGLPISDGEVLRPIDEPRMADVVFDWTDVMTEALGRRVELRRQRWLVKRRELELAASRNFLRPQFDMVGRYRMRGFGQNLIGGSTADFDNAWGNLATGQFQEYQAGAEFSMPLGFRKGHAMVRNAELNLRREMALLRELERQVVHDISAAMAEKDRAYLVVQTVFNRRHAALQQLRAAQVAFDADQVPLDLVLESQRIAADASSRFYRALIEYTLSLKNMQLEKGSLLDYNGVQLSEAPWADKAYRDAARRDSLRAPVGALSYILTKPPVVTVPKGPLGAAAPAPEPSQTAPPPFAAPQPSGEFVPPPSGQLPVPATQP
ncbi:MAG: TolC family protein [Planctomycetes bacterium]|nr:TolC family protein [Planctomycetota bacterium]